MDSKTALAVVLRKGTRLGRKVLFGRWIFQDPSYGDFTKARLQHLGTLNLNVTKKSVLEVGAGIGLLTKFFEDRGCNVLSTDGNMGNVEEMRRRYPWRKIEHMDLDKTSDLSRFGAFDVIFCYGTLYHLSKPEQALKALSKVCREIILLETRLALGSHSEVHFVRELVGSEQAVSGVGCRPTRRWVMKTLKEYFGYAYHTKTQPRHQDFPLDWHIPPDQSNYRAIFVGSKRQLRNPNLLVQIPERQLAA